MSDEDERVARALDDLARMRKEIEALAALDLESAFQTGGPRAYRGSSKKVSHGEVVVKARGGVLLARNGDAIAGPMPGSAAVPEAKPVVDRHFYRTTTPMRSKHQRTMIERIWKYRNFKRCGACGCFDTYKTRFLEDTKGIEFWCYQCGAQGEDVLKEFEPLPEAKHRQRECAICGTKIWATRGDRMFPTGEVDPSTRKPDYCCEQCHKKEEGGKNV